MVACSNSSGLKLAFALLPDVSPNIIVLRLSCRLCLLRRFSFAPKCIGKCDHALLNTWVQARKHFLGSPEHNLYFLLLMPINSGIYFYNDSQRFKLHHQESTYSILLLQYYRVHESGVISSVLWRRRLQTVLVSSFTFRWRFSLTSRVPNNTPYVY